MSDTCLRCFKQHQFSREIFLEWDLTAPRQNRIGGNYIHPAAFSIEKSRAATDNRINEGIFSAEIWTFSVFVRLLIDTCFNDSTFNVNNNTHKEDFISLTLMILNWIQHLLFCSAERCRFSLCSLNLLILIMAKFSE